ncbi:MAG: hypothetical protein ACRDFQ_07420 [Anaerolineales bacterium]
MQNATVLLAAPGESMVRFPLRWWVAKMISIVRSPPILGSPGLALLGLELIAHPPGGGWASMPPGQHSGPVLYLLALMRSGLVSDFHMSNRLERIKPIKAFLFFLLSWLVFRASNALYLFQVLALVGTLQSCCDALGHLALKDQRPQRRCRRLFCPSLGSVRIGGCTRVSTNPLVTWARLILNRHDLAQTLAGALSGFGFMFTTLALIATSARAWVLPALEIQI